MKIKLFAKKQESIHIFPNIALFLYKEQYGEDGHYFNLDLRFMLFNFLAGIKIEWFIDYFRI